MVIGENGNRGCLATAIVVIVFWAAIAALIIIFT